MGFNGLDANAQHDRDPAVAAAFGKELKHFSLPGSQMSKLWLPVCTALPYEIAVQHGLGDVPSEIRLVLCQRLDGSNDLARRIGLQNIPSCARAQNVSDQTIR